MDFKKIKVDLLFTHFIKKKGEALEMPTVRTGQRHPYLSTRDAPPRRYHPPPSLGLVPKMAERSLGLSVYFVELHGELLLYYVASYLRRFRLLPQPFCCLCVPSCAAPSPFQEGTPWEGGLSDWRPLELFTPASPVGLSALKTKGKSNNFFFFFFWTK